MNNTLHIGTVKNMKLGILTSTEVLEKAIEFLKEIDVYAIDDDLLLGILAATLSGKQLYSNRPDLYKRLETKYKLQKRNVGGLLGGLS